MTHLPERRINIVQGEFQVSDDPSVVLTTILGSCIAACLHDPVAGIGGMNHFLLPEVHSRGDRQKADSYGVHLMELLTNALMKQGARKDRLQAKVFGGAKVVHGLSDIGGRNAEFAEHFLKAEGIPLIGKSVGGDRGRRLQYWPASGRARQSFMEAVDAVPKAPQPRIVADAGELELF